MFPNPPTSNTIVITGGTGSFGSAFTRYLLDQPYMRVRVLSRDEHKQEAMMRLLPPGPRLTYILGDVKDILSLRTAFDGAWAVVHAASLKIVGLSQMNADEYSKVIVDGTRNVVDAAIDAGVRRSVFISSDKAVHAINAYGKFKASAEEIFIHGNKKGVSRGCTFSVARGGNVWASNGSVANVWRASDKAILIHGTGVTRFNLCMPEWTAFVYRVLGSMWGGEIFAPIAPAWNLMDLARAFNPPAGSLLCESRPGDKKHETLISADEMHRTVVTDWAHIIEPPEALRQVWHYEGWSGGKLDAPYSSDTARRMSMEELKELWAK